MKKLTRTGADALKDILFRDGFEMQSVEYPYLFMLNRVHTGDQHETQVQRVLINIRGKHHASWWMKGRREEFGIPASEFAVYTDMARSIDAPLYFIFYEGISNTLSYISSNDVITHARVWERDNVDIGGTIFVPKRKVIPLACLENDQIRYINHFRPENFAVQTVLG